LTRKILADDDTIPQKNRVGGFKIKKTGRLFRKGSPSFPKKKPFFFVKRASFPTKKDGPLTAASFFLTEGPRKIYKSKWRRHKRQVNEGNEQRGLRQRP
jgi:hypothetical protein